MKCPINKLFIDWQGLFWSLVNRKTIALKQQKYSSYLLKAEQL